MCFQNIFANLSCFLIAIKPKNILRRQTALKYSGYNFVSLSYMKHNQASKQRRNHNRIWFISPINKNVVNNVAKSFP